MRFVLRALTGLALLLLAAGLAGLGGRALMRAAAPEAGAPAGGPREERAVAVVADTVTLSEATPVIAAYGEIASRRSLRLSSPVGGRVVWLAEDFRDGARVEAGEALARIDPAPFAQALAEAEAGLKEARADAAEAEAAVAAAGIELEAARTQVDLRRATLQRQRRLAERGVAAASAEEEAELALAAARQAVAGREQAVRAAELRAERAGLGIERARLALAEARRDLEETELSAPFAGMLAEVSVTLGDLAQPNEVLARLIDLEALEARIRLTAAEAARLLDDEGRLAAGAVEVAGDAGAAPATLDRLSATAEAGGAGRLAYARLQGRAGRLRPGDFVSARIEEAPLADVADLPAAAATEDGRVLLIDEDDRLREIAVEVLRRQGDRILIRGAPEGARYVAERAPQLGPGLKARVVGAPPPETEAVALSDARRERLRDFVAEAELDEARRAAWLEALEAPEPPAAVVREIEAGLAAAG